MKNIEDLNDIFNIFHDGSIIKYEVINNVLKLTIEIRYLAELIEPDYTLFYLLLYDYTIIDFTFWMNPPDQKQRSSKDIHEIFSHELGILNAEIIDDYIKIYFGQSDNTLDYCGGTLKIKASQYQIVTENNTIISLDELDMICNKYWNEILPNR